MAQDIIANIAGAQALLVQPETIAVSCLPKIVVAVQCKPNLEGTGLRYVKKGETATQASFKSQEMEFCTSDNMCHPEFRTNFGEGTLFVVGVTLRKDWYALRDHYTF